MNKPARKIFALMGGIGLIATGVPATYAQSTSTMYRLQLQEIFTQTDQYTTVYGYAPESYQQWAFVGQIDTNSQSLSIAPYITNSSGTTVLEFPANPNWPVWGPTGKSTRYQEAVGSSSLGSLSVGTDPFTFWLGASAEPQLSLAINSADLPPAPMVTSGGTWSGNVLQIDADTGATLSLNSSAFSNYSNTALPGGIVGIDLFYGTTSPTPYPTRVAASVDSVYVPKLGYTDPILSTYTINPGELTAGQSYILQVNFQTVDDINQTPFSGTGISGSPLGYSFYNSSTFITIDAVPLPACGWLMLSGLVGFGTMIRKHRTI